MVSPQTPDPGRAEDWSDEDLDRLSEVTSADADVARSRWRQDAPEWARDLPDAETEEE